MTVSFSRHGLILMYGSWMSLSEEQQFLQFLQFEEFLGIFWVVVVWLYELSNDAFVDRDGRDKGDGQKAH